jgi:hypothetical protein
MTDDSRAHHRVSRDSTKKVAEEKEGKAAKRKRLFSLFTIGEILLKNQN